MSLIWAIIVWAVFGIICGALGRLFVPGRQPMGIFATMAMGILGSFIGGFIAYLFAGGSALQPSGFILSVIGAVIAVITYTSLARRGRVA